MRSSRERPCKTASTIRFSPVQSASFQPCLQGGDKPLREAVSGRLVGIGHRFQGRLSLEDVPFDSAVLALNIPSVIKTVLAGKCDNRAIPADNADLSPAYFGSTGCEGLHARSGVVPPAQLLGLLWTVGDVGETGGDNRAGVGAGEWRHVPDAYEFRLNGNAIGAFLGVVRDDGERRGSGWHTHSQTGRQQKR